MILLFRMGCLLLCRSGSGVGANFFQTKVGVGVGVSYNSSTPQPCLGPSILGSVHPRFWYDCLFPTRNYRFQPASSQFGLDCQLNICHASEPGQRCSMTCDVCDDYHMPMIPERVQTSEISREDANGRDIPSGCKQLMYTRRNAMVLIHFPLFWCMCVGMRDLS